MAFCVSVPLYSVTTARFGVCRLNHPRNKANGRRRPFQLNMNIPPPSTPATDDASKSKQVIEGEQADSDGVPEPTQRVEDELTSRIRNELAVDGINLDDLLDASTVLKLTREQDDLMAELDTMASDAPNREAKEARLAEVQQKLSRVRRQVMQPFLKRVFLVQGIIFAIVGGLLASNNVPSLDLPLVAQVLGFWTVWLFTIPALRARKGTARWEKSALNISFVSMPLVNVIMPVLTKNCSLIWGADIALLVACYLYYVQKAVAGVDTETDVEQAKIRGLLKYLDWGSWR